MPSRAIAAKVDGIPAVGGDRFLEQKDAVLAIKVTVNDHSLIARLCADNDGLTRLMGTLETPADSMQKISRRGACTCLPFGVSAERC